MKANFCSSCPLHRIRPSFFEAFCSGRMYRTLSVLYLSSYSPRINALKDFGGEDDGLVDEISLGHCRCRKWRCHQLWRAVLAVRTNERCCTCQWVCWRVSSDHWAFIDSRREALPGRTEQVQFGLTSLLIVMVGVVLTVVCQSLVMRYDQRIDLTRDKRFSLSEHSEAVLDSIDNDVTVYAIFRKRFLRRRFVSPDAKRGCGADLWELQRYRLTRFLIPRWCVRLFKMKMTANATV